MDASELKNYIRKSVKKQLRETAKQMSGVPKDFDSFKMVFMKELKNAGAPDFMLSEARGDTYDANETFNVMWETWENVKSELSGVVDTKERLETWNDLKKFYVKVAVKDLLSSR